jgi:hypothetical protein
MESLELENRCATVSYQGIAQGSAAFEPNRSGVDCLGKQLENSERSLPSDEPFRLADATLILSMRSILRAASSVHGGRLAPGIAAATKGELHAPSLANGSRNASSVVSYLVVDGQPRRRTHSVRGCGAPRVSPAKSDY